MSTFHMNVVWFVCFCFSPLEFNGGQHAVGFKDMLLVTLKTYSICECIITCLLSSVLF
ncbi:hypothetical protein OIU79_012996 [Salix purpurea]|uniref:Uncharacterized protein n=1 Tax=Salix purpurea TaxID=77065 RepID=A0A9Q0Q4W4_SALPP|nr:hypothetical protein OIU79_012996 [Salix purpurea]